VAVCLLLSAHRAVIFAIAHLSCYNRHVAAIASEAAIGAGRAPRSFCRSTANSVNTADSIEMPFEVVGPRNDLLDWVQISPNGKGQFLGNGLA